VKFNNFKSDKCHLYLQKTCNELVIFNSITEITKKKKNRHK